MTKWSILLVVLVSLSGFMTGCVGPGGRSLSNMTKNEPGQMTKAQDSAAVSWMGNLK